MTLRPLLRERAGRKANSRPSAGLAAAVGSTCPLWTNTGEPLLGPAPRRSTTPRSFRVAIALSERHAELQRQAREHLWLHFTHMSAYQQTELPIIERGDGPYLFGSRGKRYLG